VARKLATPAQVLGVSKALIWHHSSQDDCIGQECIRSMGCGMALVIVVVAECSRADYSVPQFRRQHKFYVSCVSLQQLSVLLCNQFKVLV